MTDKPNEIPPEERHEPPHCIKCKGEGRWPTLKSDGHGTYSRGMDMICPECKGRGRIFVWKVIAGAMSILISSILVLKGL